MHNPTDAQPLVELGHLVTYSNMMTGSVQVARVVEMGMGEDYGRLCIENPRGSRNTRRWVDLGNLEPLNCKLAQLDGDFTFLPPAAELRELGFIDYTPGKWYLSMSIDSHTAFDVTIMKDPAGFVYGEPYHPYTELVLDEDFGQPAMYGHANEDYRESVVRALSGHISLLSQAGIAIRTSPHDYSWPGWPQELSISGVEEIDLANAHRFTADSTTSKEH